MLNIDVHTTLLLLVVSNITIAIFLTIYKGHTVSKYTYHRFIAGKFLQTIAWLLLGFRNYIPDLLSVYIGNSLLFFGIASECLAISTIYKKNNRLEFSLFIFVLISIFIFCSFANNPAIRIGTASSIASVIYGITAYILIFALNKTTLQKVIGCIFSLLSFFLISRSIYGFIAPPDFALNSPHLVQTLTFFSLFFQVLVSGIGYLLILKEQEDKLLIESEEKYRTLVEKANEAIMIIQDEKIVFNNKKTSILLGIDQDLLIGKNFTDFISELDFQMVYSKYNKRLAGEYVVDGYDFRMNSADGRLIWVSVSATRILWKENYAILALFTDITQKKNIEDALRLSEAHYRLLAENVSDVIWILNLNSNKFTYISPSVYHLRGYTPEEAMQQNLQQSLTPEFAKKINDNIWVRLAKFNENKEISKIYIDELQQPCKSGEIIWIETSTRFFRNAEGEIEIIGLSRNIEERKKFELSLIKSEEELKQLNATKDKFFSIIAHDLRGPFSSIIGFSELLNESVTNFNKDEIEKYVNYICSTASNTYKLLENLLEWARMQTGKIDFNPILIHVNELLFEVTELYKSLAENKSINLQFKVYENLNIFADKNMIYTILRNLITNAIKFTPKSGNVTIEAKRFKNDVHISVTDTGIGMEYDLKNKLFKLHEKVTKTGTENESGTGLGLLLCKDFIERHGGKIWIESQVGVGSTFTFSIPEKI